MGLVPNHEFFRITKKLSPEFLMFELLSRGVCRANKNQFLLLVLLGQVGQGSLA